MKNIITGCILFLSITITLTGFTAAQQQGSSVDECVACNALYPGYQTYFDSLKILLNGLKIPQTSKDTTLEFLTNQKQQLATELGEIIIFEGDFGLVDLKNQLQESIPTQSIEQYQQLNKLIGQKQLEALTKGSLNQKISSDDYKGVNQIINSIKITEQSVQTPMFSFSDKSLINTSNKNYITDTITYKQLFKILRAINQQVGEVIKAKTPTDIWTDGMTNPLMITPNFIASEQNFYTCFRKTAGSVCRGGERVKIQFKDRRDTNLGGFKKFSDSIQNSIKRLKQAYSADNLRSLFSFKNRISGNLLGVQLGGGQLTNNALGSEWTNRKDTVFEKAAISYGNIKQQNALLAEPFEKKPCDYSLTIKYGKKDTIYENVALADKKLLTAINEQVNDGSCLYHDIIQDSMVGDMSELTTQGPSILKQIDELGNKVDTLNEGINDFLKSK